MAVEVLECPNEPVPDEDGLLRKRLEDLGLPEGSIIRIKDVTQLGKSEYFHIKGSKIDDTSTIAIELGIKSYLGADFNIVTNFKNVVRMNLQDICEIVRYDGIDYLIGSKKVRSDKPLGAFDKYFLKILSNDGKENGTDGDNIIRYADGIKYLGDGVFQYQESGQTKTVDVSKKSVNHNGDSCHDEHMLSVTSKVNEFGYKIIENPLNGKHGLVDESRITIFECEYDLIWRLYDSEGKYYLLVKNGIQFIFDAQSRELLEFKYELDGLKIFQKGLLRCIDNESRQYVYFDEELNSVLETKERFNTIFYKNGYLCKQKLFDGAGFLYSIVNCKTGKIILPYLDVKVNMMGERFLNISDWGAYEGLNQFDKYIFFDYDTGEFRDVFFTISPVQDGCFWFVSTELEKYTDQGHTLKKELPKPGESMI